MRLSVLTFDPKNSPFKNIVGNNPNLSITWCNSLEDNIEHKDNDLILVDLDSFSSLGDLNDSKWDGISVTKGKAYDAIKSGANDFWLLPENENDLVQKIKSLIVKNPTLDTTEIRHKIAVKTISNKVTNIYKDQIVFIEANADLAYIHFKTNVANIKRVAVAQNLKSLSHLLDENDFFRIHRKYLVNREFVVPFDKYPGDSINILYHSHPVPLARRRKLSFNNWYKKIEPKF